MSATVDPRPVPVTANRFGLTQRMLPLVASAIVLAIALAWQTRWVVNPDTSWIISICERLLDGGRLYVDVIETNPPFSIWLYLPVVHLANLLGVAPEYLVHGCTYAICLAGLGFAAFIARRANFPDNPRLFALLPAFLALLVLLPGNSFSEREQFGVALLLPLLVLMAWRASQQMAEPGLATAILAGLAGSVIVLVKPYYAVVILAPAFYVAWRRRSPLALLAPEYWAIATASAAYLACVMWLYPEFLRDVYPLLADTYLRIRRPLEFMLVCAAPPALALWLLRLLRPRALAVAAGHCAGDCFVGGLGADDLSGQGLDLPHLSGHRAVPGGTAVPFGASQHGRGRGPLRRRIQAAAGGCRGGQRHTVPCHQETRSKGDCSDPCSDRPANCGHDRHRP